MYANNMKLFGNGTQERKKSSHLGNFFLPFYFDVVDDVSAIVLVYGLEAYSL